MENFFGGLELLHYLKVLQMQSFWRMSHSYFKEQLWYLAAFGLLSHMVLILFPNSSRHLEFSRQWQDSFAKIVKLLTANIQFSMQYKIYRCAFFNIYCTDMKRRKIPKRWPFYWKRVTTWKRLRYSLLSLVQFSKPHIPCIPQDTVPEHWVLV